MTIKKLRSRKREKSTLFTLRLNVLMELKYIGRLFQTLITLSQKKVQRIPVLCGLKTLYL